MDVASPKAGRKQAERRYKRTAIHAEKVLLACGMPMNSSSGLDARDEIDDTRKIRGQVSEGARDERQVFAVLSIFPLFFQDS